MPTFKGSCIEIEFDANFSGDITIIGGEPLLDDETGKVSLRIPFSDLHGFLAEWVRHAALVRIQMAEPGELLSIVTASARELIDEERS